MNLFTYIFGIWLIALAIGLTWPAAILLGIGLTLVLSAVMD